MGQFSCSCEISKSHSFLTWESVGQGIGSISTLPFFNYLPNPVNSSFVMSHLSLLFHSPCQHLHIGPLWQGKPASCTTCVVTSSWFLDICGQAHRGGKFEQAAYIQLSLYFYRHSIPIISMSVTEHILNIAFIFKKSTIDCPRYEPTYFFNLWNVDFYTYWIYCVKNLEFFCCSKYIRFSVRK